MAGRYCVFFLSILGITNAFLDQVSQSYPPPSTTVSTQTDPPVRYVTEQGFSGTFSSPNYPQNYPNNALYVYDIGRAYFPTRLIFSSFDLEYCPECQCDNVTIIPSNRAEQRRVLCGFTLPNGNGVLDFSGPVQVRFSSNFVYTSPGFQARYEIGQQPTTRPPPSSRCPPPTCPTCRPGYATHYNYLSNCPTCECIPEITSPAHPPSSRCPPPTCPTCRPGYATHYNYLFNCPTCECIPEITSPAATSACPPAVCPTCGWKYAPRIRYDSSCPECRCVYVGTSPHSLPPASTWPPMPASTWPALSTITTPPVPASTYPPPRSILSELFRIHGELSDLQDKAKQIDNDVINLMQQLEGSNRRSIQ